MVPDPKFDCNTSEEDSLHASRSSLGLSIVWHTSPELSSFCQKQYGSLSNLVHYISASPISLGLEKFAVSAWLVCVRILVK